jgi:hypothetical protein
MKNRTIALGLLLAGLGLFGCKNGTLPDPNDPSDVGVTQPDVLRNDLKGASDSLYERVYHRELTDKQAQDYLAKYADDLVSGLKIEKVPVDKAWEYADVFRTARNWKQAQAFYKIAVKNAKNEDRRVNDSLRLAEMDCKLHDVPDAIKLVRSTFNTPPGAKAPILIATLLEVVPAGRGQGYDKELGLLLEDAIKQGEETVVDPTTVPGNAYILALPHHVANAWLTCVQLFMDSGHPDLAQKAGQMANRDSNPHSTTL